MHSLVFCASGSWRAALLQWGCLFCHFSPLGNHDNYIFHSISVQEAFSARPSYDLSEESNYSKQHRFLFLKFHPLPLQNHPMSQFHLPSQINLSGLPERMKVINSHLSYLRTLLTERGSTVWWVTLQSEISFQLTGRNASQASYSCNLFSCRRR